MTASPSAFQLNWFRRQVKSWAKDNLRDFPWRRTRDPYAIFVAESLLQKTGAEQAEKIYSRFLDLYPTVSALAAAELSVLESLLAPLGLQFRAQRLHNSAHMLLQQYGGTIPPRETELLKLPGVGPYTAKAICASAFGQRAPVLDVNVARILGRFFGLPPLKLPQRDRDYNSLTELAAPQNRVDLWNLALLDLGALVCVARTPKCDRCPLAERCLYLKGLKMCRSPIRIDTN